jgi:hypothetical protein
MAFEISDEQIRRQDFVDNAVFQLIQNINPSSIRLYWDIEMIGEIRDNIRQWLVEKLGICDEMSFYPFTKE